MNNRDENNKTIAMLPNLRSSIYGFTRSEFFSSLQLKQNRIPGEAIHKQFSQAVITKMAKKGISSNCAIQMR